MAESMPQTETMPQWATELLASQAKLASENEELKKKIRMFADFAGKNQIKGWEEQQKDKTMKFATFKVLDGKIAVGSDKLDRTKFNAYAKEPLGENLFISLIFRDGTRQSINYSDFTNIKDLVKAKILESGEETSLIEFEDGEQIRVKTAFLNA